MEEGKGVRRGCGPVNGDSDPVYAVASRTGWLLLMERAAQTVQLEKIASAASLGEGGSRLCTTRARHAQGGLVTRLCAGGIYESVPLVSPRVNERGTHTP